MNNANNTKTESPCLFAAVMTARSALKEARDYVQQNHSSLTRETAMEKYEAAMEAHKAAVQAWKDENHDESGKLKY